MINTMQSDQNDKLTFINLGTRSQFIAKNKPYLLRSTSAPADLSKKSLYTLLCMETLNFIIIINQMMI